MGIGAGPWCDGQVLVFHDFLGITPWRVGKLLSPSHHSDKRLFKLPVASPMRSPVGRIRVSKSRIRSVVEVVMVIARSDRPEDAIALADDFLTTTVKGCGMESRKEVVNPVTGERIVFLRTATDEDGEFLEFDDFWTRQGHRVPEHIHPEMEERWEVVSGSPIFVIGGIEHTLSAGDKIAAPPGTPHMGWNPISGEIHLRVQMRPPMRWRQFTEELFGLAREGETDEHGLPTEPHLSRLLMNYRREIAPSP
jgi:mannose-6-phosphate isomerase-like protein (cupin superfamily)